MNRSISFLSLSLVLVVFFMPQTGFANLGDCVPGGERVCIANPLDTTSTIQDLIKKIITWLTEIGGIVAVGMIIWGAIQIILSGGNEERLSKGKKTILYTVIGYGIILIGWGIESIIKSLFN